MNTFFQVKVLMIQSQSYKHIDVNEIVVRKIKNGKIIEKDYFTC